LDAVHLRDAQPVAALHPRRGLRTRLGTAPDGEQQDEQRSAGHRLARCTSPAIASASWSSVRLSASTAAPAPPDAIGSRRLTRPARTLLSSCWPFATLPRASSPPLP